MKTLLLPIFLFSFVFFAPTSSTPVDERSVCGDFVEGACDLSEYNIIEHNRYTNTPKECQVLKLMAMVSPLMIPLPELDQ